MATRKPVSKKTASPATPRAKPGKSAARAAPSKAGTAKPAQRKVAAKRAPAAGKKPPIAAKSPSRGKPAKSSTRTAALKTQPDDAGVSAFLARVADPARRADCEALNRLLSDATGAPPRMWGSAIVGFGQFRLRYPSGRELDWLRVGYSPRKGDLTLYLNVDLATLAGPLQRLGRHTTGKSCLYLKSLSDVDPKVLRELVLAVDRQLDRRDD
jgi:hypothetical protein